MSGDKIGITIRVVVFLCLFVLPACGGRSSLLHNTQTRDPETITTTTVELSTVLAEVEAQAKPDTISIEMWGKLTEALVNSLDQHGGKFVCTAPDSTQSQVEDLKVTVNKEQYSFEWTYRNAGDYDLNGEVNVADLVPLGVHFGKKGPFEEGSLLAAIDGDGNGEINLSDVAVIGQNYKRRCTGYRVYVSETGHPSDLRGSVGLPTGEMPVQQPRFTFSTTNAKQLIHFKVVPVDDQGTEGIDSVIATTGYAYIEGWPMFRHDPQRTGCSTYVGSQTGKLKWKFATTGPEFSLDPIAVLDDGTIYARSGGRVFSVSPDGKQNWSVDALHDSQIVVNQEGTLYARPDYHHLYAYSKTGAELWTYESEPAIYGISVAEDGNVVLDMLWGALVFLDSNGDFKNEWSSKGSTLACRPIHGNGNIFRVSDYSVECRSAEGTIQWSHNLGGITNKTHIASLRDDGVLLVLANNTLVALAPEGISQWEGDVLWTYEIANEDVYEVNASILSFDEENAISLVYTVGDESHYLVKLNVDGEFQWQVDFNDELVSGVCQGQDGLEYVGGHFGIKAYNRDGLTMKDWPNHTVTGRLVASLDGSLIYGPFSGQTHGLVVRNTDGSLVWDIQCGGPITSNPVVSPSGEVVFGCWDKFIYSVSPSGTECWKVLADSAVYSSPVITPNGDIHIGVAWDTGSELLNPWVFNSDGSQLNNESSITLQIENLPLIGSDGNLYGLIHNVNDESFPQDRLIVMNSTCQFAEQGSQLCTNWQNQFRYPWQSSTYRTSIAYRQDGVLIVCVPGDTVYAISSDGSIRWTYQTEIRGYVAPVVGADGTVYLNLPDASVLALDEDGGEKWSYETGHSLGYPVSVNPDGDILCPIERHWPDPAYIESLGSNGQHNWSYEVDSHITTPIAVGADGVSYFGTEDCLVVALNQSGNLLWKCPLNATGTTSPVIGPDGTVYVASWNGQLYAFGD